MRFSQFDFKNIFIQCSFESSANLLFFHKSKYFFIRFVKICTTTKLNWWMIMSLLKMIFETIDTIANAMKNIFKMNILTTENTTIIDDCSSWNKLLSTSTTITAYATTIIFLNQLILCFEINFRIVNFTTSLSSLIYITKTFAKFNSIIRFKRQLRDIWTILSSSFRINMFLNVELTKWT